jgi:hypothetical protein
MDPNGYKWIQMLAMEPRLAKTDPTWSSMHVPEWPHTASMHQGKSNLPASHGIESQRPSKLPQGGPPVWRDHR